MTDSLRDRIAAALRNMTGDLTYEAMANAVIRELDDQFLDFALWLSEELKGEPMSRIDAKSCVEEWKWPNDESCGAG